MTAKVQPQETPSQRFERIAQKVMNRQRRRDERLAKRLKEGLEPGADSHRATRSPYTS